MPRVLHSLRLLVAGLFALAILVGVLPARPVSAASWCPPQTSYCAENAFLTFYLGVDAATGGYALDILGLPISPALRTPGGLIVQFYERAVFEWHPENPVQYQVELARLGALRLDADPEFKQLEGQPPVPCPDAASCYLFAQTQHTVRGLFKSYYEGNGGLPVFGLALTEQFQDQIGGQVYTAQYFERNRFEAHPEQSNPRYQVLLGRLGAEYLATIIDQARTWPVAQTPDYTGIYVPPAPPSPPSPPAPPPSPVPPFAGVTFVSVVGGPPGAYASVTVQTAPGASCDITYTTPLGNVSTAAGLYPKTADGSGRVSWSWKIGTNTRPGTGTVTVTCNGASASAGIQIG